MRTTPSPTARPLPPPGRLTIDLHDPDPASIHIDHLAVALASQPSSLPSNRASQPVSAAHLALLAARLVPKRLRTAAILTIAPSAYLGPLPSTSPPMAGPAIVDEIADILLDAAMPLYLAILKQFRVPAMCRADRIAILHAQQYARDALLPDREPPNPLHNRLDQLLREHPPLHILDDNALLDTRNPVHRTFSQAIIQSTLYHCKLEDRADTPATPESCPPLWLHSSLPAPPADNPPPATRIATLLAYTPRFAGLTGAWSIAHHSILTARFAPPQHRLHALLHDAHEIFVGDIPLPTRQLLEAHRPGISARIADTKQQLDHIIRKHLGIRPPSPSTERSIHDADAAALDAEFACFFPNTSNPHNPPVTRNAARAAFPPLPGLDDKAIFGPQAWLSLADIKRCDAASAMSSLLDTVSNNEHTP